MQQEMMTPPNGVLQKLAASSSPFASPDQSSGLTIAGDFIGLYPSIFAFSPGEAIATSSTVSLTPDDEEDEEGPAATANRLYLARLALQYRDLAERYELCLSHFQDAVNEAESLREEVTHLRALNAELTKRLGLLSCKQSGRAAASIADELRRLRLGSPVDPPATSPRSVLSATPPTPRAPLPKSISVRSSGYLKLNPTGTSVPGSNSSNGRIRVPTLPSEEKGDSGEEEALEFDVYNQGMFKTELCNKWEETGACPYGDHCQFAHGIGELRPVIRHPRYKTEVCRMVLAGDPCPYGHRCHFRHALSPSERFHPLRNN